MKKKTGRRPGRPTAADSAQTLQRVMDAAREEFAQRRFTATTFTSVAKSAGLSPASLDHYADSKAELYELVFNDTLERNWTPLKSAIDSAPSMLEAAQALTAAAFASVEENFALADFLSTVPIEARRHPELSHLIERRNKYQGAALRSIVAKAIESGELAATDDVDTLIEGVRLLFIGWSLETHFRPEYRRQHRDAFLEIVRRLTVRPTTATGTRSATRRRRPTSSGTVR